MSTKGDPLYHPINGSVEETWHGFSWPAFLFEVIWLAVKQIWVHFIVCLVILFVTRVFALIPLMFFYGFMGNSIHRKSLLSKGYLTREQFDQQKDQATAAVGNSGASAQSTSLKVADELAKLAQLRDSGILTEIEFSEHKRKLLNI